MARPYEISITNGVGTKAVLNGTYAVTSTVQGYDNTSILPVSQTVSDGVNTYAFTVAATGTLTLHVTENGTAGGTAVVGATFKRCDAAGNEYGAVITTDEDGNAVFPFVPYAGENAPLVHYKQLASDGEHEFDSALKNTALLESTKTVELTNAAPALRTINLTDPNYAGLPIETGTLTLT